MGKTASLDAKRDDFGETQRLLKKAKLKPADVGKIFYADLQMKVGKVASKNDFELVDPDQIGGWTEIGEFDVEY